MDNQAASPQPDAVDPPPPSYQRQEPRASYTIYLLTVWHDSPNHTENASNPAGWRFRLENPRTKESKGFVGVAALMAGLIETSGKRDNDIQREQEGNRP
jgi:hypothetical protein